MRLVENWRKLWKSFSVWAMGVSLAILNTWNLMPPEMKAIVPPRVLIGITSGLLILGVIGRYVKQPVVSEPAAEVASDPGQDLPSAGQ